MKAKKAVKGASVEKADSIPPLHPAHVTPTSEATVALAPDFKNIYANFVQAQFSAFDFSLMIGEMMGPGSDGKTMIQQKVRVVMSPMEIKIMLTLLTKGVQQYEKQFGEISVHPGLLMVGV
jgi:hypothetical protein